MDRFRFKPKPRIMVLGRFLVTALTMALVWMLFSKNPSLQKQAGGRTIVIDPVTEPAILTVSKDVRQKKISGLRLRLDGSLQGRAEVVRHLENAPDTRFLIGPGDVNLNLDSSFSGGRCRVEYRPKEVVSGNLTLHYKFRD